MQMTHASDYVIMEFPSLPENVGFARSAAAVFASRLDFTLDELDDIRMAVSEAVTNAVVHAYENGPGIVRITAEVAGGQLVITVEDRGKGIPDVEWAKQPANTTAPDEHLGLGFHFIGVCMDGYDVESRVGGGTRIRMVKRPAQAKRQEPAASSSSQ